MRVRSSTAELTHPTASTAMSFPIAASTSWSVARPYFRRFRQHVRGLILGRIGHFDGFCLDHLDIGVGTGIKIVVVLGIGIANDPGGGIRRCGFLVRWSFHGASSH